jgi:hypothetical protein
MHNKMKYFSHCLGLTNAWIECRNNKVVFNHNHHRHPGWGGRNFRPSWNSSILMHWEDKVFKTGHALTSFRVIHCALARCSTNHNGHTQRRFLFFTRRIQFYTIWTYEEPFNDYALTPLLYWHVTGLFWIFFGVSQEFRSHIAHLKEWKIMFG